jgi:hypothetical protein
MASQQLTVAMFGVMIGCLLLSAQGSPHRVLLQSGSAASFECGKPMGPCGTAIPAGVTCDKGPGYCQPGYFCGWEQNTGEPSKCLPVPAKCGQAGNPCCPSNTKTPHTSNEDKLKREPYCSDGSTCFFFRPMAGLPNGDIYAGNKGRCCSSCCPDTRPTSVSKTTRILVHSRKFDYRPGTSSILYISSISTVSCRPQA